MGEKGEVDQSKSIWESWDKRNWGGHELGASPPQSKAIGDSVPVD